MAVATQKSAVVVDVFDYQTAPDYLRAVLQEKTQVGKSLRAFTRWSGLGSPATLSQVVHGKRAVSEDVERKLIRALRLSGNRKRYLRALTALTRTKDEEGRLALQEEVFYIKHIARAKHLEVKQYEFFSRWYYSVVYVLVGLPDFNPDPLYLSRRLGRYVSPQNIATALNDMVELGLLTVETGKYKQSSTAPLKTPDEVAHLSLRQYHRQMIRLANQAMQIAPERREVTALTVGLPLALLPQVKQRIRQFRESLDEFLDKHQHQAEEVYQLNIQFFPLTFSSRKEDIS